MTGDLSLNGYRMQSADLLLPYEGRWTADGVVDMEDAPTKGTPVRLHLLGRDYQGHVVEAGKIGGAVQVRIAGGNGGLDKVLEAQHYRNTPTVAILWADLLRETGESGSPSADTAGTLSKWTRTRGEGVDLVGELASKVLRTWRVLVDGSLWMGRDQWYAASADWTLISGSLEAGRLVVSAEEFRVSPGEELDGLRIRSVRHMVRPGHSRSLLVLDSSGTPGPFNRIVDRWLRRRGFDYSRPQPARVLAQDSDGTLQVRFDDSETYPDTAGVPIRCGLPHAAVKVAGDSRVVVEWEGGDPGAPVVSSWGPATAQEITIGPSPQREAARKGDAVDGGTLTGTVVVAGAPVAVQFTYTPPGGAPVGPSPTATLQGKISAGSSVLKVGG